LARIIPKVLSTKICKHLLSKCTYRYGVDAIRVHLAGTGTGSHLIANALREV